MKSETVIITLLVALTVTSAKNEILHRKKRFYLVFPGNGLFKLVVGIAIPVKLGLKQSLVYGLNFQFQYGAAQNITQLQQYPPIIAKTRTRRKSDYSDRKLAYMAIEATMERYGVNGRQCLLRSICENSGTSLHRQYNGLYGHLIHIILTPDYGDGEVEADLEPVYSEAQAAGKFGIYCESAYPQCAYGDGFLDFISFLDS